MYEGNRVTNRTVEVLMKKRTRGGLGLLVLMLCFLFCGMTALAEEEPTIQAGIYAESRNLE